ASQPGSQALSPIRGRRDRQVCHGLLVRMTVSRSNRIGDTASWVREIPRSFASRSACVLSCGGEYTVLLGMSPYQLSTPTTCQPTRRRAAAVRAAKPWMVELLYTSTEASRLCSR